MNNSPLISICIPVYNGAATISRTIESILSQTYKNWELIISDNCSTDNTKEIILKYKDERIFFSQNSSNIGFIGNCKKLMSLAKGEYIKIVCADDIIYPECLEKQLEVFLKDKSNNIVMVTCDINIIDIEDKIIMKRKIPFKNDIVNYKQVIDYNLMTARGSIMEPFQILTKRDLYIKEMSNCDNDFATASYLVGILLYGDMFVIRETLGAWRLKKGSLSSQLPQVKLQIKAIKDIYKDKRFKVPFYKFIIACFIAYITSFIRRIVFNFYAK